MNKLETTLSNKWIKNLKEQCTENKLIIRTTKIHGGNFQETGISDWLICYKGFLVSIEFKIPPNVPTGYQWGWLEDIAFSGGIAILLNFQNNGKKDFSWGQERLILEKEVLMRQSGYNKVTICNFNY